MAIYSIYFLFFTYKAKYSAIALNTIDRQNTYNIIMAIRGIVELFRLIKHKKELY
jgi:hypothetical protein